MLLFAQWLEFRGHVFHDLDDIERHEAFLQRRRLQAGEVEQLLRDAGEPLSLLEHALDGIYDEFAQTLEETFQEVRKSGKREEMRPKMEALRSEKDELMKDILSDDQWLVYAEMNEAQKKRMEERRKEHQNSGGPQ